MICKQSWLVVALAAAVGCGSEDGGDLVENTDPTNAEQGNNNGIPNDDDGSKGDDGANTDDGSEDDDGANTDDGSSDDDGSNTDDDDGANTDDGSNDDVEVFHYYRANSLSLLEPGFPARVVLNGILNNQLINGNAYPFGSPDDLIDVSFFVGLAEPVDGAGQARLGGALCFDPLDERPCVKDETAPFYDFAYSVQEAGTCLTAAGQSLEAPCVVSEPRDLGITLTGLGVISLQDFRMAAKLGGGWPPASIEESLMTGFLSEEHALKLTVPKVPGLEALEGQTVSAVFRKDQLVEHEGQKGWWLSVTSSAAPHAFEAISREELLARQNSQ